MARTTKSKTETDRTFGTHRKRFGANPIGDKLILAS